MKTIIVILALLYSFSFLQAQVKTIDFVMLDGTKKQIPIEEIDTIRFNSTEFNRTLELEFKDKPSQKLYANTISELRFVLLSPESIFLNIRQKDFTLLQYSLNELKSIKVISLNYSHGNISLEGFKWKYKSNSSYQYGGNNGGSGSSSDSSSDTSARSFYLKNGNGGTGNMMFVNCSRCNSDAKKGSISYCYDYSSYSSSNAGTYNDCSYNSTIIYLNAEKKVIDSVYYWYVKQHKKNPSYINDSRFEDESSGEYLVIKAIPYAIDDNGVITASIKVSKSDLHLFYNYSYSSSGGNTGYSYSSSRNFTGVEALDSNATINLNFSP